MSISSPLRELLDAKMHGGLERFVATQRRTGASWDTISVRLLLRTDIEVSGESLRNWYAETEGSSND